MKTRNRAPDRRQIHPLQSACLHDWTMPETRLHSLTSSKAPSPVRSALQFPGHPSTFSHERRRLGLKTTSSPINPDFYDRTGNLEIVRRRSAFLTSIIENHFFSLESEHPQHGSFERIRPYRSLANTGCPRRAQNVRPPLVRNRRMSWNDTSFLRYDWFTLYLAEKQEAVWGR